MSHGGPFVACVLSLSLALFAACGGDDETSSSSSAASTTGGTTSGCGDDPFSCAPGQVCWPFGSLADPQLQCLNSGPGQIGDPCQNVIGQPACSDELACFAVSGEPNVCTPFCDPTDPAHACPDDGVCLQLILSADMSLSYYVCRPEEGGGGGGGSGGAGGGGTGGGGGS